MGRDRGMGIEIAEVSGMRDEACSLNVSTWVTNPLGFQDFYAAGPLHVVEAPPTFLLGFPIRARRGKGEWIESFVQWVFLLSYGFPLVFAMTSV
ncbi:hypothetical protein Pyn_27954 [Prunus yedoensis var. nudiflora]|uniref:Uncharacterized protein n=1 Tax=Prunus yedoensis var. nudiflora TaxID=2094558 RepID=A0A314Z400_PRUYE|nr:hypothetical protein Pyn_27954 [Prunus yedoensis var. nudiflora]